jgi:two-component system, NarL family, sensor histidine kinase UhpB
MRKFFLLLLLLISICSQVFSQTSAQDSALVVIAQNKKDKAFIHALAVMAQSFRGKDNDKAIHYSKQILRYPNVDPPATAKAHIMLGLVYADLGVYDSATIFFREAEPIVKENAERSDLVSVYYNGMGLFYKKQGKNEEALEYYMMLDRLGEASMGEENLAGNMINISNIYSRMGNRREAIKYLYKALPVFESLNSEKGMSYCYNNLGLLLKQQNYLKDAESYLKKSLALKEKENDKRGIATSCNELAQLYLGLKDFPKALSFIDRSILLSEELGLHELHATALVIKGRILRTDGKLDEAMVIFTQTMPLAEKLPNHFLLSALQTEIGKAHAQRNENEEAIRQLKASIVEAGASQNVEAQQDAYLFLSEVYSKNKQYQEALDQFQNYHALADSLTGQKLKLEYKALESQYQLEKKNAEIELLRKDQEITERTIQKHRATVIAVVVGMISIVIISALLVNRYRVLSRSKRLLEIERVRNSIARDLHDDIGSTLSSINIVSQLALRQTNGHGNGEDQFRKIAEQSGSILERMSDIVWSINPENDSLPMMVSRMKEFAAEILEPRNINYSFSGTETLNGEILEVEQRKNVFLIFKEAINNAAKYSDASSIEITLLQKANVLRLEIRDNGRGFSIDQVEKGNGLRNMKDRAGTIRGNLIMESEPTRGTAILLELPLT